MSKNSTPNGNKIDGNSNSMNQIKTKKKLPPEYREKNSRWAKGISNYSVINDFDKKTDFLDTAFIDTAVAHTKIRDKQEQQLENIPTQNKKESKNEEKIKKGRVLVVEDLALNQLLITIILEEFGFELDIAENGKIAIEKLQKEKYDLILMDLQMPEMNGFETTEYIRNIMNSQIPIIALTAYVTTADIEKCKAVGMNDYIAKPIDEKILHTKIIQQIKNNRDPNKSKYASNDGGSEEHQYKYINLDYLKQRTKNNSEMILEMIEIYLKETPRIIDEIKQSRNDMNWDSLASAAHSIIPSFAIMGINKEFENMAKLIEEYSIKK